MLDDSKVAAAMENRAAEILKAKEKRKKKRAVINARYAKKRPFEVAIYTLAERIFNSQEDWSNACSKTTDDRWLHAVWLSDHSYMNACVLEASKVIGGIGVLAQLEKDVGDAQVKAIADGIAKNFKFHDKCYLSG